MRRLARIACLGIFIYGCALGQQAPASTPVSPMALHMNLVRSAAEQIDPTGVSPRS